MFKPLSFTEYKNIKRKSLNDFNRWLVTLCRTQFDLAKSDLVGDDPGEIVVMDRDHLMDVIMSVRGIGEKRAEQICDRIYESGGKHDQG